MLNVTLIPSYPHADTVFLVASDDPDWCREELASSTFNVRLTRDFHRSLGSVSEARACMSPTDVLKKAKFSYLSCGLTCS